MRLDQYSPEENMGVVRITASRRNLLALLVKLYVPSARTLTANLQAKDGTPVFVALSSEADEDHYKGRPIPPGPLAVSGQASLQVAADLIEQAADSLPDTDDGRFRKQALDKLATQVAYQRARLDDQVRIV